MVDLNNVTKAVVAVLAAKGLPNKDLSKKPSDILATNSPDAGLGQFIELLKDCEIRINKDCDLQIAWPAQLPQQNGQPFVKVYLYKSLIDLIGYLYAYVTRP